MTYTYCPQCAAELETAEVDGEERLVCPDESCGFIYYDNPTPVVAGIVQRGDEVILIQNKGWPEDWYGIVSGFLEKEEHPEDGVLREVEEEVGLDGELVEFVGLYPFEQMNQILMVYHVVVEEAGEVVVGDEIADWKAVPVGKLKPWPIGTGPAVEDWLERRTNG